MNCIIGGLRTKGLSKVPEEGKPLVSIITVVLNGEKHIEQTIKSVFEQTYDNIEYIIIDGGSDDSTIDIIKKYEEKIDYWMSEADSGISDAFNKGIKYATGDWVNFLNAGDCYVNSSIIEKHLASLNNSDYNIITGFARFGKKMIPKVVRNNQEPLHVKAMISHQASFIRKNVFEEIGLYSDTFRLRMDYEFWLRALQRYSFFFIDDIIVDYDTGGISGGDIFEFYKEEIVANKKHIANCFFLNCFAFMKCFIKMILKRLGLYHI